MIGILKKTVHISWKKDTRSEPEVFDVQNCSCCIMKSNLLIIVVDILMLFLYMNIASKCTLFSPPVRFCFVNYL